MRVFLKPIIHGGLNTPTNPRRDGQTYPFREWQLILDNGVEQHVVDKGFNKARIEKKAEWWKQFLQEKA